MIWKARDRNGTSDTMKEKECVRERQRWGCAMQVSFEKLHFERWIISWCTEGVLSLMLPLAIDIHSNISFAHASKAAVIYLWSVVCRFCVPLVCFLPDTHSYHVHQQKWSHPLHTKTNAACVSTLSQFSVSEHESLVAQLSHFRWSGKQHFLWRFA